jgi:sphingolipid delta-4 desaturase
MPSVVATASAPHLRVSAAKSQGDKSSSDTQPSARIPPPEQSAVEDQFFWTYTEEPHRSRRQAIIKAHPEVGVLFSKQHNNLANCLSKFLGNQALRA